MRVRALVMAGGSGSRMAADDIQVPKPLVRVLGVPLLERNLLALLRSGVLDLAVAVPSRSLTAEWAHEHGTALAQCWGAELEVFEERAPLGTLGAAGLLTGDVVLVVYADNLTDLDLSALLRDHAEHAPAMTVCTHSERLRIPYGVPEANGRDLLAYREKPEHAITIVSGIYVLGPAARAHFAPGCPTGAPEIANALIASGARVRTYPHTACWIDVNDAASLRRAEQLLLDNPQFDAWAARPDVEVVGAVLSRSDQVLLEWRPPSRSCYAGLWDTPGGKVLPGEAPLTALRRELDEELGACPREIRSLCTFDELEPSSQRVFRHHVFEAELATEPRAREGQRLRWVDGGELAAVQPLSSAALRSVAAKAASERQPRGAA